MSIDRRLHRLESDIPSEGARIVYVATERDAERLYKEARAAGAVRPLFIVTSPDQLPPVIDGGTIAAKFRLVAEKGSRIHDSDARRSPMPGGTVWSPARETEEPNWIWIR